LFFVEKRLVEFFPAQEVRGAIAFLFRNERLELFESRVQQLNRMGGKPLHLKRLRRPTAQQPGHPYHDRHGCLQWLIWWSRIP
jgi:hypothetical protein